MASLRVLERCLLLPAMCGLLALVPLRLCAETLLLDAYLGSPRSSLAAELGEGGYELADGTYQDFGAWYSSEWRDATVLLLTQLDRNAGVIWGFGTGERGPKYEIDPAVHAGFVYQFSAGPSVSVMVKATVVLGGDLSEESCVADYGEIGGMQEVNCRLAAEPIPPNETLQYLVNEPGRNESRLSVTFEYRF